jgi:hypothetical protein
MSLNFDDVKRLVGAEEVLVKSHGLRMAAPKYSAEQIEGAAAMALAHGKLDANTATAISATLALTGPSGIPQNIISVLEGRDE